MRCHSPRLRLTRSDSIGTRPGGRSVEWQQVWHVTTHWPLIGSTPRQVLALGFSLAGNAAILFGGEAAPPTASAEGEAGLLPPGVPRSVSRAGLERSSSSLCADGDLDSDSD